VCGIFQVSESDAARVPKVICAMRIAILGWGSLIWDRRDLCLKEDFRTGGPRLPLEFSRKSADGRLTLIIDEKNGMPPSLTQFGVSKFEDLHDAICDLQHREGTSPENIGFMINGSKEQRPPKSRLAERAIAAWLAESRATVDAVIWTNLGPSNNFPFTSRAAQDHLASLNGLCRQKALEYLTRAPDEVETPLRKQMIEWLKTK
jgi:hypothetical protein